MSLSRVLMLGAVLLVLVLLDWYVLGTVRHWAQGGGGFRRAVWGVVLGLTVLSAVSLVAMLVAPMAIAPTVRNFLITFIVANFFIKLFVALFLLIDDLVRLGRWAWHKLQPDRSAPAGGEAIPRSEFLVRTALVAGAVPLVGFSWGILSGAHDYRLRRHRIVLPNLPRAFEGVRVAQLSDIHSGSFFNKTAVRGGIEMLLGERPDVVLFTGDIVNNRADEMREYQDVFAKVKAPLGVYSVFGNHDYGDYVQWESEAAKRQNLADLAQVHQQMGWDLLRDEHRLLEVDGESIAVLGIENWGAKGRFPKYGDLAKARSGAAEQPIKILMSHDPSHWDAQVRPEFPDVDLMLSGHTHGMQFGVDSKYLKWSPVQYMYEQWAGLYQKGPQQLYVNRGFGYLGYPGRLGMLPEITILELTRG
ncbi:MAG: metallophosphoesterase [Catalinimonas sp.]